MAFKNLFSILAAVCLVLTPAFIGKAMDTGDTVTETDPGTTQTRPVELIPLQVSIKAKPDVNLQSRAGVTRLQANISQVTFTAKVTGIPTDGTAPRYSFGPLTSTIGNPGEWISDPQWIWKPTEGSFPNRLKIRVVVKVDTPHGKIMQHADTDNTYVVVDDAMAPVVFASVATVMTHPRCANCHAAGNGPTQGDDRHPHVPPETRDGQCTTCHLRFNGTTPHSPPGAPDWRMPPQEFAFAGKTAAQICRRLNDPTKTGGRSLIDLNDHLHHDFKVAWAFIPGPGRTTPSHTWDTFVSAFHTWVRMGGGCPSESLPDAKSDQPERGVGACCTVVANPALKGRLGQLVLAFPQGANVGNTRTYVYKDQTEIARFGGNKTLELMPGTYAVAITGKRVEGVTIQSGHDTTVKVGLLRVTASKDTRIYLLDTDQKRELARGDGTQELGFPIGTVYVSVAGQSEAVTIEEGKITDF